MIIKTFTVPRLELLKSLDVNINQLIDNSNIFIQIFHEKHEIFTAYYKRNLKF